MNTLTIFSRTVFFPGLRSLWPIVALLLVWQLATAAGLVAPNLLPSPLTIGGRLFEQLQSSEFLFDIAQTLVRLFAGFGLALAAGVLLGLVMALGGEFLLAPMVRLLSPIPKIALYPALVLLLGFGHASKIGLVVSEAVFPIMLATFHGVRSVQPKLVWSARAAGAARLAVVFTVLLPSAFGSILTGCRIGLVVACINVFLAEMISSTDGLGHLLVMAARSYQVVDMFVPLVLISTIGLCLNASSNMSGGAMPARVADRFFTRMTTSEANEYPGHELFLPYLVNKATTVLNVKLQKILDLQGLTLTHWRVLAFLSRQDDLTMGELASNTMTEQSTLSRSLRALETQGFVLREASPNDSRAVHVHLLAAGRTAFEDILKSVLGLEAEFTRGIPPADIECARGVLLKIIANG